MKNNNGIKKEIKKDIIFSYPLIILLILIGFFVGLAVYTFDIPVMNAYELITTEPDQVQDYIMHFGIWAPFVFLLVNIIQVIITPIPGHIIAMAGGLMFGTYYGAFLSVTGSFFGSLIAFKLSQKFGRTLIEKIAGKQDFNFFDDFFEQKGPYLVFILRMIPFMSFGVVSYGLGLTRIGFKDYAIATLLGMIPGTVIYSYLGNKYALNPWILILSSVFVLFIILFVPALRSYILSKRKKEKEKK